MVFFTCNHCGESAKKPAVAKHYQFKCRNVEIFVSCMDCQKDFKGQEYVAHTSCITEAEKYSGKDYVPKATKNTGQKKQEDWIEIVRSVLSGKDANVSTQNRRLLQRLLEFDNVPRKKPKFVNFVVNSLRIGKADALAVWEVVEQALEKFKAIRPGAKKSENEQKEDGKVTDGDCNGTDTKAEVNGSEAETKSEKKKRKKQDGGESVNGVEESTPTNNEEECGSPKKKKKKSKHAANEQEDTPQNGHAVENGTSLADDTETPKKKSKKRSKEADGEASVTTISQNANETNGISDDTPPKKKKQKTSESEQTAADSTNGGLNGTTSGSPGKFDWTNEIFNVVEKNNNEVDLEKLRKKVLKKYQKLYQVDEIPWKVQKTFNKKLKKSGLKVEGNVVRTSI